MNFSILTYKEMDLNTVTFYFETNDLIHPVPTDIEAFIWLVFLVVAQKRTIAYYISIF